jgi:hypothetical protein
MKTLNLALILTLFSALAWGSPPPSTTGRISILKDKIKIKSFSTEVLPLHQVSYIGRLELVVRRQRSLFTAKDGMVRVYADGVEVGCIQYYESTKIQWRNYLIDVGRTVRTIEIHNGLQRDIFIKAINKLPSRLRGRSYTGHASEVLDISAHLLDNLTTLQDLVSTGDLARVLELKISAGDLMNKAQVLGPMRVAEEIKTLLSLLERNEDFIAELRANRLTEELALEIKTLEMALKRLIE